MWFWVKHLSAAVVLLIIAFVVLFSPDLFQSSPSKAPVKVSQTAAQTFTNFYEQIRYSLDGSKDVAKEFIVELPDTSDKLTQTLASRTNTVPELGPNWTGNSTQRKFQPGSKIREQMTGFAGSEGIELIWTLPKDYVVKHYFHSEGDYLATLRDIATAIAPDFQTPILVFLCPKERAAVITDKHNPFLDSNCTHLNAEAPARSPAPRPN
ncbi:TcpQ domain-containing protein [Rheinheimera riviphila]|nr:TcpQ domain-containing protein [Rheinheimera riviphila]